MVSYDREKARKGALRAPTQRVPPGRPQRQLGAVAIHVLSCAQTPSPDLCGLEPVISGTPSNSIIVALTKNTDIPGQDVPRNQVLTPFFQCLGQKVDFLSHTRHI